MVIALPAEWVFLPGDPNPGGGYEKVLRLLAYYDRSPNGSVIGPLPLI